MTQVYAASPMWERICQTHINEETIADLSGFKNNPVNYKLALSDVQTNGVRFLKTLIYNLAGGLTAENWARLRKISGRDLGDPISVTYNGESVDLDYLRAVSELDFITRDVPLDGARVLEIGAGYGRTCHTLLSNHDIAEYCIVDLPITLELARKYLTHVLTPQQLAKVEFVLVDDVEDVVAGKTIDLCVNIDSLAEMNADTAKSYLALIDEQCQYFYVNNPVGKYMDKSLDSHALGREAVDLALSTGLLTDVIDIHDNNAVETQAREFVATYQPGAAWECVADAWSSPFSHYWQALYRNIA
jgi:putative sugar O-methyltransferase